MAILIGGPGTRLPFVVESFMGWSLCISCLAVSGYHYVKSVTISSTLYRRARRLVRSVLGGWLITNNTSDNDAELAWIPLTTHSRAEIERHTPWQRYLSLVQALELRYPDALLPILPPEKSQSGSIANNEAREVATTITRQASNVADIEMVKRHADNELMHALRQDDVCRRLASLAMRPYRATIETTTSISTVIKTVKTSTDGISATNLTNNKLCASAPVKTAKHASTETIQTTLLEQLPHNRLLQRISKMWKYLLMLPSLEEAKSFYRVPTNTAGIVATKRSKRHENDAYYPYQISIIMPAFYEQGSHLIAKLSKALETSNNPDEIEVIIVDAGGCTDLEKVVSLSSSNEKQFGKISIISFTDGGGRGPCLNFGAANATGRILTFCHSDTTLPSHWDKSIVSTLEHDGMDDDDLFRLGKIRSNSCAFAFGIDTSPSGLAMPFITPSQSSTSPISSYFPPGIRAVETTANLRTHLYSLPYGDQVLSLHACVFHFLGGFPDQCLMEDYELVSLLRRRAALLDGVYPNGEMKLSRISYERLAIIPGPPALCSPRRWQKFGVMYTTFTNSRLVSLYAGVRNMSADELFQIYYGKDPPNRSSILSPWELELKQLLDDQPN